MLSKWLTDDIIDDVTDITYRDPIKQWISTANTYNPKVENIQKEVVKMSNERAMMNQLKKGMLVANCASINECERGIIEAFDYNNMRVGIRVDGKPSYFGLTWLRIGDIKVISKVVYSEPKPLIPEIKEVIYNGPATIVYWVDGTKTVVKCCEQETYDPEKGLAMAICEKAFSSKTTFHQAFKKWVPEEKESIQDNTISNAFERASERLKQIAEALKKG